MSKFVVWKENHALGWCEIDSEGCMIGMIGLGLLGESEDVLE